MAQIIIHQSPSGLGNVSVCMPTGELPIEQVLEQVKQSYTDAVIVEDSILPQGSNAQFFDAWELSGSTITVNLEKAKSVRLKKFNLAATNIAQLRQLNTSIGISNETDDATFIAQLNTGRDAIIASTTTDALVAITDPA